MVCGLGKIRGNQVTAYEKSMVELVERIEVLEQWKLSFDSRLSDHAAIWMELSPAVTSLEKRTLDLTSGLSRVVAALDKLVDLVKIVADRVTK